MVSESQNYTAGRSGVGGVNYASAAWRAGDLERARIQREEAAARNQASESQVASSTSFSSSSGNYSESIGRGFTLASVFVFVVAGFYGIGVGVEYLIPDIEQKILPYVGPEGLVSKNAFFWIVAVFLTIVGILFRKVIRWVVGIGLVVAIVIGIASL